MVRVEDIKVPWNASWTGEEEFEIRNCRWVGGRPAVWQKHAPGVGRPIFAKPHMVRQRRSIAEMRCTVCGELTGEDRWWFRLGRIDEQTRSYMTTESPVHRVCAEHAKVICPHLRSLGVEPEPMPTGYQIMSAICAGPKCSEDFKLPLVTPDRPVIGAMKIAWPLSTVIGRKAEFGLEVL